MSLVAQVKPIINTVDYASFYRKDVTKCFLFNHDVTLGTLLFNVCFSLVNGMICHIDL